MTTSSQAPGTGPHSPVSDRHVKHWLTTEARALGFADCRIAPADLAFHDRLDAWLAAGHHAGMGWMAERSGQRGSPAALWPEARSVVMLAMNYGPESDPLETLDRPEVGTISVYARHRDYHDVIKGKLKALAQKLAARTGGDVKVFVDTAPLMEKPLAQAAGLGWQGKHTVLLSRGHGNWLFLGAILTNLALEPDAPEAEHCGSCRRCLDVCPTAAFPAPHVLDSRRCISYLTIEHKGPIDRALRPLMGNRIYGCDDCLAVCPWNKFAQGAREAKLMARDDLAAPPLADLLMLDDAAFRAKFSGSPIKRTGRNRFIRNVLIAAGNAAAAGAGSAALAAAVRPHLDDPDPVVRGAAVWALVRLDPAGAAAAKDKYLSGEADEDVRAEWESTA
jgi:epoxyqueuosine reductase